MVLKELFPFGDNADHIMFVKMHINFVWSIYVLLVASACVQ
jgi:hypothetical protein